MTELFHILANEGIEIRFLKMELSARGIFLSKGKIEILYKIKKLKEYFLTNKTTINNDNSK